MIINYSVWVCYFFSFLLILLFDSSTHLLFTFPQLKPTFRAKVNCFSLHTKW